MKTTISKRKIPTSLLIKELKIISRKFAQDGDPAGAMCINLAIIALLATIREGGRRSR